MFFNSAPLLEESASLLQQMIATDTSRGNETLLASRMARALAAEGIATRIFEPVQGRGSLVAFLPGGNQPPLVLLSHLDTAPAAMEGWSYPPFSGIRTEKALWGRGAIDCKGLAALHFSIFLELHRRRLPLSRDIYLIATAGEEEGGWLGAARLPEQLSLPPGTVVLGEGGGFSFRAGDKLFFFCQVGEKGRLKLTPGTPVTDRVLKPAATATLAQLPLLEPAGLPADASLRLAPETTTHNCTVAEGSVTFSILPGTRLSLVYQQFTKILQRETGCLKFTINDWTEATGSSTETAAFRTLRKVTRSMTGAGLFPLVTPGYSDNRFFRRHGCTVYGFQPLDLSTNPGRVHGKDEHISLQSLELGIRVLGETVAALATA